jgi:hypothetical protein
VNRSPIIKDQENPNVEFEDGKNTIPAENARGEELSTKTACTLLFVDHSSMYFL